MLQKIGGRSLLPLSLVNVRQLTLTSSRYSVSSLLSMPYESPAAAALMAEEKMVEEVCVHSIHTFIIQTNTTFRSNPSVCSTSRLSCGRASAS